MIQVTKANEFTGHTGAVYALERSESTHCIYSGSGDKIVAKWNLGSLNPEKFSAQLPGIIYSLCLVPEKNILLAGTAEGKIHVIDLSEKKEIKILQNHTQAVFDIQYSPENNILLSAGGDGSLTIVSLNDLTAQKVIKLCTEKLRAIDISGNRAAIACGDGFIRIVDLKSHKLIHEFRAHKDSVYSVKFSPDGRYLLSGGKDAHLNVWKDTPGTWQMERSVPAHNYAIYSIVFSPDGTHFATASRDKTFKIWNALSYEVQIRVNKENHEGHINSVNKLYWNTSNNLLVSAGDDRKIMTWKIETVK